MTSEELAALMAAYAVSPDIQVTQTAFRQRIVQAWGIEPGWRVLEVGCGQGDMTAALADRVGPGGHVTAIDPAPGSYGAPVNLADSTRHLAEGPLGDRIDFHLDYDLLRDDALPVGSYDAVVLAHCTWYFASLDQLTGTIRKSSTYAPRLRVSEWSLVPDRLDQVPHLLAVLIRGQLEATNPFSEANVRTPMTIDLLAAVVAAAGWVLDSIAPLDTVGLQDADWEIGQVLRDTADVGSEAFADLVQTEVSVLTTMVGDLGRVPLPSAAIAAHRPSP